MRETSIILLSVVFVLVLAMPISEPTQQAINQTDLTQTRDFGISYTSHAAFDINNDGDLSAAATSGYGNSTHPYIIEGYIIDSSGICIDISGTTAYFIIRDCYLTYSSGFSASAAIRFNTVVNGAVEDTYIDYHRFGASMMGSTLISFVNVTIDEPSNYGLSATNTVAISAENCTFKGGQYGVYFSSGCGNAYFYNNTFEQVNQGGLYAYTSDSCQIIDNDFISSAGEAIEITDSESCQIINNTISNCGQYGISTSSGDHHEITGNDITDCALSGIYVQDTNGTSVESNTVYGSAIELRDFTNGTISDNEVTKSGFLIIGTSADCWNHAVSGNIVNGKPLAYIRTAGYMTVDASIYGQVIVSESIGMTIQHGVFDDTINGVTIAYATDITIHNVSIVEPDLNGDYGIYCYYTTCTIDNVTTSGYDYGIYASDCGESIVNQAISTDNDVGIVLDGTINWTVSSSTFSDNSLTGVKIENSDTANVFGSHIENNPEYGIYFDTVVNSNASGNLISYSNQGIRTYLMDNTNFSYNTIQNCEYAFYAGLPDGLGYLNNTIENCPFGMHMYLATGPCWIYNNTFVNGGLSFYGTSSSNYDHAVQFNTVNGKPLGYFHSIASTTVDTSQYGQLIVFGCSDVEFNGGTFDNATSGVVIFGSDHCNFTGISSIHNILEGFHIIDSPYCIFDDCEVSDTISDESGAHGFYAYNADYNEFYDCSVSSILEKGFFLYASTDCVLVSCDVSEVSNIAIHMQNSPNVEITGCTVINAPTAVGFSTSSTSSTISSSTFINCTNYGISSSNIANHKILGNYLENCGVAIYIAASSGYNITGNTVVLSHTGIRMSTASSFYIVENNCSFNSNHGIEMIGGSGADIYRNIAIGNGEFGFRISGNADIRNNTASANIVGIYTSTGTSIIEWNNCTENDYGFYVYGGMTGSDIRYNRFISNNEAGVFLPDATSNSFYNNTIQYNGIGIYVSEASTSNSFYLNRIEYNIDHNAFCQATSDWDNGVYGNWWSDYDYSGTYSVLGSANEVDNHPMVDYITPSISTPADVEFVVGSTGYSITWDISITYPDSQELFINGVSQGVGAFAGYEQTFSLDGLTSGQYNYTLLVWDDYNATAVDTVIVTVIDPTIVLSNPSDFDYELISTGHNISWAITGDYTGYEVYLNDVVVTSGSTDGSTIIISVDGLAIGSYNYTILVFNEYESATDSVFINVEDTTSPTINSPDDIEYDEGETGNTIEWIVSDGAPDSYTLTRNDTVILAGPWNGSSIQIDVDHLTGGFYVFTLRVEDTSGNSAWDTVVVQVMSEETLNPTTPTTSTTTTTGTTPPAEDSGMLMGMAIGGAIGAIVVIVVVIIINKKK